MKIKITRRKALGALLASSAAACAPTGPETLDSSTRLPSSGTFSHGIASGDPLADRVILWTRITPEDPRIASLDVNWEVSKSENFSNTSSSGTAKTSAVKNWTVKVDAKGLEAGAWYYYRFTIGKTVSPTGKTRTLPQGKTPEVRFAVVSCANWQHGYFNVYDHIARTQQTAQTYDALLHLGDYLYEYSADKYASKGMIEKGRVHEPRHEIVSLEDYRIRHAQYRSDPSLQAVTSQMPMIAIWDDHESSNDSWIGGAENHDPETEGNWDDRKQAAMRAYYEWMPIRNPEAGRTPEHLYRSFEWGDLITLAAVETRLLARSESFEFENYFDELLAEGGAEKFRKEILQDPNREMLGEDQQDWIVDTFAASEKAGKPWRVLVNQVLVGKMNSPDMTPYFDADEIKQSDQYADILYKKLMLSPLRLPLYPDCWDGYPAARERFYQALDKSGIRDMLVLTGDSHEFWANDLTNEAGEKMGIELGTTSISSETTGDVIGDDATDYALLVTQSNKDVRFYDPTTQGYIDLTFTPSRGIARMIGVDTVSEPQYTTFEAAKFAITPQGKSLRFTSPDGLNIKQRALFHGVGG